MNLFLSFIDMEDSDSDDSSINTKDYYDIAKSDHQEGQMEFNGGKSVPIPVMTAKEKRKYDSIYTSVFISFY
jgi:hypothetical protein